MLQDTINKDPQIIYAPYVFLHALHVLDHFQQNVYLAQLVIILKLMEFHVSPNQIVTQDIMEMLKP